MKRSDWWLLVILALAACGGDDAGTAAGGADARAETAAPQPAGQDISDITEYRLTMAGMDRYFQTLRNLTETMKNMTPEEMEAAELPSNEGATIEQMIDNAESSRIVKEAAQKAGSTPREYVLVSMAYMQSAMASAMMQMQPNANQDSLARLAKVNPANIEFIRENEAELTQKYQAVADEMKAAGLE